MSGFRLGTASLNNRKGIHPDLIAVLDLAIQLTPVDFMVTEGLRTEERQRQLVDSGASRTMNSRHITGDAFDFAPYIDGRPVWESGDDFDIADTCEQVADAILEAGDRLGIPLVSGLDWDSDGVRVDKDADESFFDGFHIERPKPWAIARATKAMLRRVAARSTVPAPPFVSCPECGVELTIDRA